MEFTSHKLASLIILRKACRMIANSFRLSNPFFRPFTGYLQYTYCCSDFFDWKLANIYIPCGDYGYKNNMSILFGIASGCV